MSNFNNSNPLNDKSMFDNYEVDNACSEVKKDDAHVNYTTLDIPEPPPITDDMTDSDILRMYGLNTRDDYVVGEIPNDGYLITQYFMFLQYWHQALEANMAKLIRIEHGFTEKFPEDKSEVVRRIFEFSGRYIRDCKKLIDGMELKYGNDLDDRYKDHYLNNKYNWNKND